MTQPSAGKKNKVTSQRKVQSIFFQCRSKFLVNAPNDAEIGKQMAECELGETHIWRVKKGKSF